MLFRLTSRGLSSIPPHITSTRLLLTFSQVDYSKPADSYVVGDTSAFLEAAMVTDF